MKQDNGSALWIAFLFLGSLVAQIQLSEIRFSTERAESIFRFLYLVPAVLIILLCIRAVRSRVQSRRYAVAFGASLVLLNVLMYMLRKDADGQAAIFILILPFLHAISVFLIYLGLRANSAP